MIPFYRIDIMLLGLALAIQFVGAAVLWRMDSARGSRSIRLAILTGTALACSVLILGQMMGDAPWTRSLPEVVQIWGRAIAMIWALAATLIVFALLLSRVFLRVRPHHSPGRRKFLWTTQGALMAAPVAAVGYGTFVQRHDFRLHEQEVAIPDLPLDLDGLRLVQLTDIHLSPYLSLRELEHTIGMANETKAHVALVTGDLISFAGDPLDQCLDSLRHLKSDAGTFGCMGNHEIYAEAEDYVGHRAGQLGMRFLRDANETLRFGGADLNLAGVDYQRRQRPYLRGAETLITPGATNLLLSHNPDVFPVAAKQGYDLTISGHTHGGQVRFELVEQDITIARFLTPYVYGLYREGNSSIFVSRGIGTIGLPTRLGAPPEVALITLRRS